jgi:hypothetical protein
MNMGTIWRVGLFSVLPVLGATLISSHPGGAFASEEPRSDEVAVSLCDGSSTLTVPGLKPGEVLSPPSAQKVAAQMLEIWRARVGEERWASWQVEAAATSTPSSAATQAGGQQAGQPTKFTARDQLLWKREEEKWIAEGYKNFHSWEALGGTIGISCDMCHPDASNTHPETYPKYQIQSKKLSLLRDMINWCIENPMKGKPLPEDDPRLRSVEAYILSARKGEPLAPGKH